MDTVKRGPGRPSLTPTFLSAVNSAPEGQPVILQAATTPALAYHHRRNLAKSGIMSEVVAPGKNKEIGKGIVKNPTDRYVLAAAGLGPRRAKGKFIKIKRNITAKI